MFPVLHLGPLAVQTPGLILVVSYWFALEIAARQSSWQDTVYNAGFYGALASILVARIGYALLHWPVYQANPLGLLALSAQALEPLTGVAAGVLAAGFTLWRQRIPLRPLLDALAPALTCFSAGLALSHFASGVAYGTESTLPWAINLWGASRHPVQLYQLVGALLILSILWWPARTPPAAGLRFLLGVALMGLLHLVIEPFRAESNLLLDQFRIAQVVGLAAAILALALMRRWRSPEPLTEPIPPAS